MNTKENFELNLENDQLSMEELDTVAGGHRPFPPRPFPPRPFPPRPFPPRPFPPRPWHRHW